MWQNTHRKNYETMVLLYDYWYECSTTIHADNNLVNVMCTLIYTSVHRKTDIHTLVMEYKNQLPTDCNTTEPVRCEVYQRHLPELIVLLHCCHCTPEQHQID